MTRRSRNPLVRATGLLPRRPAVATLLVLPLLLLLVGAAGWLLVPSWANRALVQARRHLDEKLTATADAAVRSGAANPARADRAAGAGRSDGLIGLMGRQRSTPSRRTGSDAEAARWLADGCRTLTVSPEESDRLADLALRRPDDWTLSERDFVTALARREAEPLSMIERAGAAGASPFAPEMPRAPAAGSAPADHAGQDEIVELADQLLRGARLLLARAGLALEAAPEEAGRSLVAVAGSARALQADPRLRAQHLGTAIEELFLRGAHWAVADPAVPREVIADLRAALPEASAERRVRLSVAWLADTAEDRHATGWRRFVPGGSDLAAARRLDALAQVLDASRTPRRLLEVTAPGGAVAAALDEADLLTPLLRMQAIDASEELARLAFDLRTDPHPRGDGRAGPAELTRRLEEAPPDPFAGGRPELREGPGAWPTLADLAAATAWAERWGTPPEGPAPPPFAWSLASGRR